LNDRVTARPLGWLMIQVSVFDTIDKQTTLHGHPIRPYFNATIQ
jgi:hypothetical protein